MSWTDCHRRRAAINSVLSYAERYPQDPIRLESLPEVAAVFAKRSDLLLALQYDWQQLLWAQIELHSLDTQGHPLEASEICRLAWASATAHRPVLRQVLDRYQSESDNARARQRENDLLVSAAIGHCSADRRYVSSAQVA
ncbi:MAG: hypothetical protein M3N95_00845 [Actinomycetota bacterium]|nr:hypothetical protein [Actinomycetota bacterium]